MTEVADGSWHHLAVVRRGEGVEMYVDGISVEVNTASKGHQALDIRGKNSLTFGAFVPGKDARLQSPFYGLMREVRVWDIATGRTLHTYKGHTGGVTSVTYFPDGKRIASASTDGTARIWLAPR